MCRREIGIRIALGAEPMRVVRELAMSVARLIGTGAAIGLTLTIIAQRQLRAAVFGVAPLDPVTIAGAIVGLGLIAEVSPMPSLRVESRSYAIFACRLLSMAARKSSV